MESSRAAVPSSRAPSTRSFGHRPGRSTDSSHRSGVATSAPSSARCAGEDCVRSAGRRSCSGQTTLELGVGRGRCVVASRGGLRSCLQTVGDASNRRTQEVVVALDRLAAESAALRTASPAVRGAKLRSINDALATLVTRRFPLVFGMSYGDLLDRVITENSAIQVAEQRAATRETPGQWSPRSTGCCSRADVDHALKKQSKRAGKAEEAA